MAQRAIDDKKRISASGAVHILVIIPCMLAAWWMSAAVLMRPNELISNDSWIWQAAIWIFTATIGYTLAWGLGFNSNRLARTSKQQSGHDVKEYKTSILATLFAGSILGALLFATTCYIKGLSSAEPIDVWNAVSFGPPLFLLGLSFVVTLHIGVVRRKFSTEDREWLARLGGFMLLYAAAWTLLFGLVLYVMPFVHWLAGGGLVALGTWAIGSGVGAKLACGPSTNGTAGGSPWKEAVTLITPWLFVAGLAVIVAYGTQVVLFELLTDEGYVQSPDVDFAIGVMSNLQKLQELPWLGTSLFFLFTTGLFLCIVLRLDINLFSLHALYCNRLARAYLGASCAGERTPNPFSGFDVKDDLPFADISQQRPIHIINTAVNMTGGDDLAWQTRRAASFALTPCWAGFETRSSQGIKLGKYCCTNQYAGGRPLGTWVAVSGAAASPNMGYHTSASVATLMTAFNLRLGRWCGNPDPVNDSKAWMQESPGFAAKPIFDELTGSANTKASWVNLTDGGHFENLGVYELIRRRCRFIVVTDAGCDPKHQFEDLANMQRKCWVDFGVNVRFESEEFEPMHLRENSRYCGSYGVVGRIQYEEGNSATDGVIIYLKASMTGDEWPDTRQYADSHGDFPHQTTADQFFDENQFESYRHLGYKVAAMLLEKLEAFMRKNPKDMSIAEIVSELLETHKINKQLQVKLPHDYDASVKARKSDDVLQGLQSLRYAIFWRRS